ncbi:MAG TPA: LysM peptidoglycan-binding domain-containing protein [Clostridiaceae bacterium]|nr:LysM peptidoglycan-binding domain-containing protein [Clostridiaceae bacterium]
MVIHVVRPGDSVYSLSTRYGVSVQRIIQINGLNEIPYLVVGQALVIPSTERAYRVQPGDTLWSISRRFNVPVDRIAQLNGITNPNIIYPGMIIRIPELAKNYGFIEVNGYIEPSTAENDIRIVNEVGRFLTYISPFSYQVTADGGLTPVNDEAILNASRQYRIAPLMVITNFRGGNFDTELVDTILGSTSLQQTLIDNVINVMREKGYYGLNIDFERISPQNRGAYNDFLRRVVAALRPLNYPVSTALAPKPEDYEAGAWHGAHDYRAHGEIVDFVIIMTYEWGWSGGPPYAVAPIDLVEDVIRYAVSVIPPRKIMMGVPLYGYDWPLPYMPGGPWARRVSPQGAIQLAARYGAVIRYDTRVQAPFFNYRDERGVEHVLWFEDARSVQAKFLLAVRYGLRGVSYWLLGQQFPQNWAVLDNMFNIVKVVQ